MDDRLDPSSCTSSLKTPNLKCNLSRAPFAAAGFSGSERLVRVGEGMFLSRLLFQLQNCDLLLLFAERKNQAPVS